MSQKIPDLDWCRINHWMRANLVGFDQTPGLLRFINQGLIVYIASETRSLANFRRFTTSGGSWKSHWGGRKVHEHRDNLELEYAILIASPPEIERVRDALIGKHQPDFNYRDGQLN
jgi:hypothetical protein